MLVAERKSFRDYWHTTVQQYAIETWFTLGMEVIGGSWLSDLTARIHTYKVMGERTKYSEMYNSD